MWFYWIYGVILSRTAPSEMTFIIYASRKAFQVGVNSVSIHFSLLFNLFHAHLWLYIHTKVLKVEPLIVQKMIEGFIKHNLHAKEPVKLLNRIDRIIHFERRRLGTFVKYAWLIRSLTSPCSLRIKISQNTVIDTRFIDLIREAQENFACKLEQLFKMVKKVVQASTSLCIAELSLNTPDRF